MSSGMQPSARQGSAQDQTQPANNATLVHSADSRGATGVQQGGQPQRYPDPKVGQQQGQYPVSIPGASLTGQQQGRDPRPFTSLMQGQRGTPMPSMQAQPGGPQDGAQQPAYVPGGPGSNAVQIRPQYGLPQMLAGQQMPGQMAGLLPGQQPAISRAVQGQLQYHPPLSGQPRPQYQQYTSPPLTVQQIQQLQQLQAQQQHQLQMRAQGQQHRPPAQQQGAPQSPTYAGLPRAPMPTHMQQGLQPTQQGNAMPRPAAQPGQAGPGGPLPSGTSTGMQQPRPQMPRNTVVQHAPPMQLQVAQQQQQQMQMQNHHAQQAPRPQQPLGSMPMPALPGSEGKPAATLNPGQPQTLQSPPRPRPSPKVAKVVTLTGPIKKHCNCKNSRCLKLYCECFASGRYCDNCNCVNCCNNKESEQVRQAAVESILERNPNAFRPKIQGGDDAAALAAGPAARHNKGCNCKKSGCLKKYCECFQASIYCSDNCKCIDCKNFEGSDAREMVMMSLVHEHNRSMNAHHAAKRARITCGHPPPSPQQFSGTAAGGSIGMQLGARGAMPGIPGGMQMNQGPPGPMTQLLQQEGPPPPLHTTSALMPGASEALSGAIGSMTQQIGGSPMPSPARPAPSGPRQPLKPLVHSRAVLQDTMREMVNRGGVAEMASLLLLIAQETEQKLTTKPEADGEAKSDAEKNTAGVAGSSSSGGAGDKPSSSYSGPSRVYAAQEKAVLQEFHFILKKVSDRVLKKTAQEVEQTAAAKATASAALAAVPGSLMSHLGAVAGAMASPAPSPRMQPPTSSPFPSGVQQSPGQMRVLHIAQSPQGGARPAGPQQMPQQRMVNLSAYGRHGGPSPQSSPGIMQLQMGQRPPAGAAPAPHQPWQNLMQTGHLASPQGGPRPGTVMYSGPRGGPPHPAQSAGQHPVNIRLSNYSGPTTLILPSSSAPPVSMQHPSLAPPSQLPSSGGMAAAAGFVLPHQRMPGSQPQAGLAGQLQQANAAQMILRLPSFSQMVMGQMPGQPGSQSSPQISQPLQQMSLPPSMKQEQVFGQNMAHPTQQQQQPHAQQQPQQGATAQQSMPAPGP